MAFGIRNRQANREYREMSAGRQRKVRLATERLWYKLESLKRSEPEARLPARYVLREMACCGRDEFSLVMRILLHNDLLTASEDGWHWSVQGEAFPWEETP